MARLLVYLTQLSWDVPVGTLRIRGCCIVDDTAWLTIVYTSQSSVMVTKTIALPLDATEAAWTRSIAAGLTEAFGQDYIVMYYRGEVAMHWLWGISIGDS